MLNEEFESTLLLAKLKEFGIKPTKKLGQHFLFDKNILKKIVNTVPEIDKKTVLEIGPGPGALTLEMLKCGARVIAIEKDERFIEFLRRNVQIHFRESLDLIHSDALKVDVSCLKPLPTVLVSNLPYNIAATLIVEYLKKYEFIDLYVVTVQREVAQRLASEPNNKHYGSLSVKVSAVADMKLLFKIKPGAFLPPPKVESQVILLKRNPKISVSELEDFFDFVDLCFAHRRKTLVNNLLEAEIFFSRNEAIEFLRNFKMKDNARPEEIELETYLNMFEHLKSLLKQ
ncbi:MAG: 16S rRNA (adenine(1518)-N(6)/adenine(1519)-N(6))-dimethyltransferase RsmA [Actinobacteria bacterium]|nr:16S rRNA (adenine(1518)-N(6)/adenine(1519)-N(6))-dimethyltransferase RsmA [Actinomycetota bacterium]